MLLVGVAVLVRIPHNFRLSVIDEGDFPAGLSQTTTDCQPQTNISRLGISCIS